jgi:hypothetical protein
MTLFIEWSVLIVTLVGLAAGVLCITWAKASRSARRVRWGRRLFIATFSLLGATALVAALARANGLAPLGLLCGLLIVGMLWENPTPTVADDSSTS